MHKSVLPEMGSLVGVGFICFASLIVLYVVHSLLFAVPHPKGVPLLRELPGKTRFSLMNRLDYFGNCESIFREAYQNVSVLSIQDT